MFRGTIIRVIWIVVGCAKTYAARVIIGIHVVLSSSCVIVPEELARAALAWPTKRVVGHGPAPVWALLRPTLGFAYPKILNWTLDPEWRCIRFLFRQSQPKELHVKTRCIQCAKLE